MANFQITLVDPVTGLPDITVENGVISIVDHSNYGDAVPEAGHARANFTDYYKVKFVLPNGLSYLYSSKYPTDGDVLISTPSAGDPTVDYTYTTGDGQYWIYVYSVPTYAAGASYLFSTTPYVWYADKLWQCLQNSTGSTPTENANWHEVTLDELPAKYRIAQRTVIVSDAKRHYARRIYNANVINNRIGENWEQLLKDPEYIDACRYFVSINSVPVLMAADDWSKVDTNINFMKQLSAKYEVL